MAEPAEVASGLLGCPNCGTALIAADAGLRCPADGTDFPLLSTGLMDLRPAEVIEAAARFSEAYRAARIAEGWQPLSAEVAGRLPDGDPPGYNRLYWPLRRESWAALLRILPSLGAPPLAIADAGAGFLWSSHRLALLGHRVLGFDLSDDADFGVGAARLFPTALPSGDLTRFVETLDPGHFLPVLGDLEHPPLAQGRFDAVICNASLHYVNDLQGTLDSLTRALRPGGALIVLDSPIADAGWDAANPAGGITRGVRVFGRNELDAALRDAGLTPEWIGVRRGPLWARRQIANWLRRRPGFDFPLIVAHKTPPTSEL